MTTLTRSDDPAHVVLPRVHRVASRLTRGILGTHHGSISPPHLDYDLDEFTFRFTKICQDAPLGRAGMNGSP